MTPQTRWIVGERDREAEGNLQRELGIPSLLAAVLVRRGFHEPAAADRFLNPRLDQLHDPRKLPDYEAAKNAILGAKERDELIFVHGDYDVDGVTSAAIFHRFLSRIGCRVHTHVPHRMREGYGIHLSAVEEAKTLGAKLFLTCDCGVGAHEQVEAAKEAGMAVVVTDHHSVGAELPAAEAVINPHRIDSVYPFSELSGAGVVFKLCEGLSREIGLDVANYHRAYLDLAALGTIADVMPLEDENRIIARFGLERLTETKKVGLRALMREASINLSRASFFALITSDLCLDPASTRRVAWMTPPSPYSYLSKGMRRRRLSSPRQLRRSTPIGSLSSSGLSARRRRRSWLPLCTSGT